MTEMTSCEEELAEGAADSDISIVATRPRAEGVEKKDDDQLTDAIERGRTASRHDNAGGGPVLMSFEIASGGGVSIGAGGVNSATGKKGLRSAAGWLKQVQYSH